jgi:NAD(P)-dependent dehydrogenase (short-subunit alcohol dehydrogenase family)
MIDGKVVIITGSAGGVGRYVAKTFAQAGAKLVVADIKPLDTISGELTAMATEYLAVPTDVQDESAVQALFQRTMDRFGRIDVLHNNAAIVSHSHWEGYDWPRIRDLELSFWRRVMQTNLGGTFLCTKHVLPYLEARRAGHIINTTGGGNPLGPPGASPYIVSKTAIRSFTRFVAEEEREFNICVVAMGPGGKIATEDAPPTTRAQWPGPEVAGDRFVRAAQAPMAMSGFALDIQDGQLVGELIQP